MVYVNLLKKSQFGNDNENIVMQKNKQFVLKQNRDSQKQEPVKVDSQKQDQVEAFSTPLTLNNSSIADTLAYKDASTSKFQEDAISDQTGLERAANQGDAYSYGNTLYVTGSHTSKDWFDDLTKVPFWGDVKNSTRYIEANKALQANPAITRVVGHSLGGSVALELQKNNPNLNSQTYGAPVWDPFGLDASSKGFNGTVNRISNLGDPVSFVDGSAKNNIGNPIDSMNLTHGYNNISSKFSSGASQITDGYINPDNSVSLIQ